MDQCAEVPPAEVKVDEENSMDTSQNDSAVEDSLPNSSEVTEAATPETKVVPEKKARGSGRKRKSDADMMAEAKATCGHEIDPSEGRQLRKRPDPPKVEKKTPARKPAARKSKTPNKEDEKETMVENDVKEHVDGVKDDDDSQAESSAEQVQQTNGDDTHEAADEVTDNGGTPSVDPSPVVDADPAPAEPTVQNSEKPVEEEAEQKTEEPERITPTEGTENSTNNSV